MATKRFRLRYTFWLDLNDPNENTLADQIERLKTERSFAKTVRDGIRLLLDLRAGKSDVLFELFPWVKAEFLTQLQSSKMASELDLQRQLERLEKMLATQPPVSLNTPHILQPVAVEGSRALSAPKLGLSHFDDGEGDTLVVEREARNNSTQNLLNAALSFR
jgi:hypothetical protein